MIERKQLFAHVPPYSVGDCHRTAIACVLDMEPDQVPHFGDGLFTGSNFEGDVFEQRVQIWLATKGLVMFHMALPEEVGIDGVCRIFGGINQGILFLLGGRSAKGTNHTVVADSTGVLWDPSYGDGDGQSTIVGPMDDGHYWASLMISLKHKP